MAEVRGVEPESMPLERSWDFHEWGSIRRTTSSTTGSL